jgi:hypothetical protein
MGPVEFAYLRRLSFDVSGLEYGFDDRNRRLLWFLFALFAMRLAYFAYCTVWQNVDALQDGEWFIFLFYLALPVAIFLVTTVVIARRCHVIAKRVHDAEKRIRAKQLNLP